MRRLDRVPERPLPDLQHLASVSGVDADFLEKVVERRIDPYHEFKLLKSSGRSSRTIAAPMPDLAKAQRWILDDMLGECRPGPNSYAYQRGVSVKDCAKVHAGARWLVKLDLKDFFNSFDERRVTKIFRMTGTDEVTSVKLAKLCTRIPSSGHPRGGAGLGYLPQGASTSGMLANLASHNLDRSLTGLAYRQQLRYTRYSDDITFSSPAKFQRAAGEQVIRAARDHIARNNFVMNEKKTRICPPGSRLMVLGLLVDSEQVRLTASFKKTLNWHVYGCKRFGIPQYSRSQGFLKWEEYLLHVEGLFAHAMHVEPNWAQSIKQEWFANAANRLEQVALPVGGYPLL